MKNNQLPQNISLITRILLWLSKTDKDFYIKSPRNVQLIRKSLGYLVLFTGVFAFITASYFARTLLHQHDAMTKTAEISTVNLILSYCIGLLFSTVATYSNMEFLATRNWLIAIAMLLLFLLTGLVIAIPHNLGLFPEQLNEESARAIEDRNLEQTLSHEKRITQALKRINLLHEKINEERNMMARWGKIMEDEIIGRLGDGRTGIAGKGPAYRLAKENFELHKSFEQQYVDELALLRKDYDQIVERDDEGFAHMNIEQSYGFVSHYIHLKNITKESSTLRWLGFFTLAIFVLIAFIPAFLIKIKKPDDYDKAFSSFQKHKTSGVTIPDDG